MAEPDAVVIAASTRQLAGDLFEYRDLDAVEVKGIAEPVRAWQVLRPSVVASRFEALRGSALTRLIGCDEVRRWARARAGDGQVVLISGEPGLGKSRITAALAERLHAEPHLRLAGPRAAEGAATHPHAARPGAQPYKIADDLKTRGTPLSHVTIRKVFAGRQYDRTGA